ncbi:MAG: hypothetical protein MZV63_49485 [Marinilabiliales bacterium]|nr:hypothetical protein [Marinilabiliales bacterium]
MVTEITLGIGSMSHLAALDEVAAALTAQGLAASWPSGQFTALLPATVGESCPQ